LNVITSSHVIAKQEQAGGVEAHSILVSVSFVKERSLTFPPKDVIRRRYPFFFHVDDKEPDAANEVNVHQKEKDQLYQFYACFDILSQV